MYINLRNVLPKKGSFLLVYTVQVSPKASEHYNRSDDEDTKRIMTKTDAKHSPHDGKDKE